MTIDQKIILYVTTCITVIILAVLAYNINIDTRREGMYRDCLKQVTKENHLTCHQR